MTDEDVIEHDRAVSAAQTVIVVGEGVVEDEYGLENAGGSIVFRTGRRVHHADAGIDVVMDKVVSDLEAAVGQIAIID